MSRFNRLVALPTASVVAMLLAVLALPTNGQTTRATVVTVQATDATASKAGDPGAFTIYRTGDLTSRLMVFFQVLGTAVPGVDYAPLGVSASLAPGAASVVVPVTAMTNSPLVNTQTVVLQIAPSLLAGAAPTYEIGSPSNATVYVRGPATNLPPMVAIIGPANGAAFLTPGNVPITASATDPDGAVAGVQFFAGATSIGSVTGASAARGSGLFSIQWSNPPAGNYALTAVATDNLGAAATSAPVNILVTTQYVLPVVTVTATVPTATQPCGTNPAAPGKFTISRDANTNVDFLVSYHLSGTVVIGVDYARLSNAVVIPAGAWSADILVNPMATRSSAVTETVELDLLSCICPQIWPPPADWFRLGTPAAATVFIKSCLPPTNLPPVVRLTSPPDRATFRSPLNLPLYAYAVDADGWVTTVEFLAGSNSLGFGQSILSATGSGGTNPVPPVGSTLVCSNMFVLVWSNPPAGSYSLTARATDNSGASTVSAPVNVTVLGPLPPPPTNRPTAVSIVATDPIAIEGTNCWVWAGTTNATATWTNWGRGSVTCWYTNCGPKNANFTITRWGDTNAALTVFYGVGGTASNGVDYVALPGSVSIPPGARSVLVPIVPIDDGPPDTNSTVILKLIPSTNYVVSLPASAAALIVDGNWLPPRLAAGTVPALLTDKCFHLSAAGPNGAWFQVLYSTNAVNWIPICTNQVINGSVDFIDPEGSATPSRFYRALPQSSAP